MAVSPVGSISGTRWPVLFDPFNNQTPGPYQHVSRGWRPPPPPRREKRKAPEVAAPDAEGEGEPEDEGVAEAEVEGMEE